MTIRLLSDADIPAAMRLKEAASWNQTEEDWRRLLRVAPHACFGVEHGGALVSTTSAVCYGRSLAWIGMVLTAPEHRGKGFAHRLMEHTLQHLRERGIAWAKLDATEMGAHVYADFGFEHETAVERWCRPGELRSLHVRPLALNANLAALDERAFGADRLDLLNDLASQGGIAAGSGYLLARDGSNAGYLGSCVALDGESARHLVFEALRTHPGVRFYWDLLSDNAAAIQIAHDFGFHRERRLSRMALRLRPDAAPLRSDPKLVYALAGFEYG